MVKVILVVMAMLGACISPAFGQEVVVHTVSRHSAHNGPEGPTYWAPDGFHDERTPGYNNQNFGLGYRSEDGNLVGAYRNSYRTTTVYLGRDIMPLKYAGGFVALATGYGGVTGTPATIIGGLILRAPLTLGFAAELQFLPKVYGTDGVVHLTFSVKIPN